MVESYPFTAIVLALSLIVYIWVTLRVGRTRAQYKVAAPATDGPVEFQRVFRVQMNTLEQLAVFMPSLALFAASWGDSPAAALGIVWPISRILYARSYYAGTNRSLGFGLSFILTVLLLLGGLVGAIMAAV